MNAKNELLKCNFSKSVDAVESGTLGIVEFGKNYRAPTLNGGVPTVSIKTSVEHSDVFFEQWKTQKPLKSAQHDNLYYCYSDDFLFCVAEIKNEGTIAATTKETYISCFNTLNKLGYNNIFRMWNFIPDINNANQEGLEIYKDFCLGRAEAFEEYSKTHKIPMPAATGIGTQGGELVMYLLASPSDKCLHIENPRQIPAFTYPRKHGPKSPSFARATYLAEGNGMIFVSGTASIIGHETVHENDIVGQCETTFENISLLISQRNCSDNDINAGAKLTDLDSIKVYVRHAHQIPIVRELCSRHFSSKASIAFLNVDICRSNLLVEIEGVILNAGKVTADVGMLETEMA